MTKRAVWHPAPGDPRGFVAWMVQDEATQGEGIPIPTLVVWLAVVGLVSLYWSAWVLLAVPFPLLMLQRRRRRSDVGLLVTEPPPGPAYRARLKIRREPWTLGVDDGIVTFVDGWLHFAGRRTEFAVRAADVRGVCFRDGEIRFKDAEGLRTRFLVDDPEAKATLEGWKGSPTIEGESLLPPASPHPSGVTASWLGAIRIASFALVIGAVVFSTAPWWISGGFVWAVLGRPSFWTRVRELRSLGREARHAIGSSRRALPP